MCSKNVLDVSQSSMETEFKKDVDLITNRYVWHLFPHEANLAQEKASGDCADGPYCIIMLMKRLW